MDDLISRQDAIEVVDAVWEVTGDKNVAKVWDQIKDLPTVQPERKTGRWIDEGFYADGHGAHAFRCSECGGHIIEYDADPFCRWCGADMREEEQNETN